MQCARKKVETVAILLSKMSFIVMLPSGRNARGFSTRTRAAAGKPEVMVCNIYELLLYFPTNNFSFVQKCPIHQVS